MVQSNISLLSYPGLRSGTDSSFSRILALNGLLALLYIVFGRLTFAISVEYGNVTSVVFMPEGIALAFTVLFGPWVAPGILIGQTLLSYWSGPSVLGGFSIGLFNAMEGVLGGYLVHRWKLSNQFDHPREVALFVAMIFFILQPISATGGVLTLYVIGAIPHDMIPSSWAPWWIQGIQKPLPSIDIVPSAWAHWWMGNSIGQLLFAPLLIAWLTPQQPRKQTQTGFYNPILIAVAVGLVILIILGNLPEHPLLLLVITYPLLVWIGLVNGIRMATMANILIVPLITWIGTSGHGFMSQVSVPDRLAFVGYFIAIGTIFSMLLYAMFEERRNLVEQLTDEREKARMAGEVAQQANTAKTRFLGQASHDLRQPVQALILFIMELRAKKDKPISEALLRNIQSAGDALDGMLNGLLDLSRVDSGNQTPEISDFSLTPIFERIQNEFNGLANAKGLKLQVQPTTCRARSDPGMLERILQNLVNNALRFTEQGSVLVTCQAQGNNLLLEVRDSGPGIPEEAQNEIFKEFFQLDNPMRDHRKGLGLGLSIVRVLSQTLEHPVTLRSTLGEGSVFSIQLPAGRAEQIAASEHARNPDPLKGQRIAVIDDDPMIRDGLYRTLSQWGCEVITGEKSEDIIQGCNGKPPAAIIADFRLEGDRHGPGEINDLRAHFGLSIPAGLISGEIDPEILNEILATGLTLLNKPFAGFKLRGLLTTLLTE